MTDDIWEIAPEWATHYSPSHEMFFGINDDGVMRSYDGQYTHEYKLIERPKKEWDGTGLPPAGTRCLYNKQEVTIVAHVHDGKLVGAIFQYDHNGWRWADCGFEPIPTQEQKEREAAIDEMTAKYKGSDALRSWAEYVYDELGYRKPKPQ